MCIYIYIYILWHIYIYIYIHIHTYMRVVQKVKTISTHMLLADFAWDFFPSSLQSGPDCKWFSFVHTPEAVLGGMCMGSDEEVKKMVKDWLVVWRQISVMQAYRSSSHDEKWFKVCSNDVKYKFLNLLIYFFNHQRVFTFWTTYTRTHARARAHTRTHTHTHTHICCIS
jgi:hypothetical protein